MNTIYYNDLISTIKRTISQLQNDVLTTIGDDAFRSCRSLTSINLPKVTTVGSNAFSSCKSLTSINLPNVTMVEYNAFSYCDSLKEIHFATKNKKAIEALSGYSDKFGATNATIYFDI